MAPVAVRKQVMTKPRPRPNRAPAKMFWDKHVCWGWGGGGWGRGRGEYELQYVGVCVCEYMYVCVVLFPGHVPSFSMLHTITDDKMGLGTS